MKDLQLFLDVDTANGVCVLSDARSGKIYADNLHTANAVLGLLEDLEISCYIALKE